MEWIIGLGLLAFVVWRFLATREEDERRRRAEEPEPSHRRQEADRLGARQEQGTPSLMASVSIRQYDTDKYRFDGLAFPEFRIIYQDETGVVSERDIFVLDWRERGGLTYYDCWCFARDDRRTFRSDRIISAVNILTNRKIKNIAAYRSR